MRGRLARQNANLASIEGFERIGRVQLYAYTNLRR